MPGHIEEKHAGQEISEDFEKEYVITRDEMIHLKILKGQLDRPPVKRAAKRNAGELEDVPKGKNFQRRHGNNPNFHFHDFRLCNNCTSRTGKACLLL
jgi:hypothetical protein